MMRKTVRFIWAGLGGLACVIATAWAAGALYFDLPIAWLRSPLALVYGLAMLGRAVFGQRSLARDGRGRCLCPAAPHRLRNR